MPDEWVSIAQAAQVLHITERHARRLAALIGEDDRRTDTLPTGRRRLAVRLAAIQRAHSGSETAAPEMSGPIAGTLPAELYQKVIADKDAEIQYLRSALLLAQENLAREQTLRALPPPAEPIESEAAKSAPRVWRWPWSKPPTE